MMDGKIVDGKKVMYRGIGEAVKTLVQEKGFSGFYAGFNANVQRIVSWNVVMFLTKEWITSATNSK